MAQVKQGNQWEGQMAGKRINCWEYKGCGREPGGQNAATLGVCPAAMDKSYDGINSGKCAGRFCWAVAGTLCEGGCQGTYADKQASCLECDFFKIVRAEEGTLNLRTKFLRFLSECDGHSVLRDLKLKQVKKSTRFIVQGEQSQEAYIIKSGSCILIVEKGGDLHPIDHRGQGDIVNMSALFTGEPISAHIEAETDMELWVLEKTTLEKIPGNNPALFGFLTEIVADRFDSKRPISDRTIGPYVATDIIGRGGYSIVYKGMDSRTQAPVAIKMMRHHMALEPDFIDSFRNEEKIVTGLNHGNIVRVFEIIERFRTAFIVMEHLKGESLAQRLGRRKKLSPGVAVDYLIQACRAIGHAYKKGVLHMDICPANLMITQGNVVKLIDFGLARFVHEDEDVLDGSFKYLAPEVCNGDLSSIQSDLYALGITAYEMITGQRPYPEDDPAKFIKLRRSTEVPDPRALVPAIPHGLRKFILTACRLTPQERYEDPDAAMADLKDAQRALSVQPPRPLNCWEVMKCGRGPDITAKGRDTCPAAKEVGLDGMNQGQCAGRACWLVAGTYCCNAVSGTFAEKIDSCRECKFYKAVNQGKGQSRISMENVEVFGLTHVGLRRTQNEDRYLIRQMDDHALLLAVADGLGGNVSSDVAAEVVNGTLTGLRNLAKGSEMLQLKELVRDLDARISQITEIHPELKRMATTLVCGILKNSRINWINLGDSRLYLFRDKKLHQLSEDQTLARFLIQEGELLADNAPDHYSYDILDQCIGYGECTPETGTLTLKAKDLILLSTDGLHKMVPLKKMIGILEPHAPIEAKTHALTQAALDGGGLDNVTIVMAEIGATKG